MKQIEFKKALHGAPFFSTGKGYAFELYGFKFAVGKVKAKKRAFTLWSVTELQTGFAVSMKCHTRADAIQNFKDRVESIGEPKFRALVASYPRIDKWIESEGGTK